MHQKHGVTAIGFYRLPLQGTMQVPPRFNTSMAFPPTIWQMVVGGTICQMVGGNAVEVALLCPTFSHLQVESERLDLTGKRSSFNLGSYRRALSAWMELSPNASEMSSGDSPHLSYKPTFAFTCSLQRCPQIHIISTAVGQSQSPHASRERG
ncbi:hypothetical protein B0H10DRAFT_2202536, partial [Mycena sp. CBHHK59/15]